MAQIRYASARFEMACGTAAQLPEPTTPEVAFAGRSNVGKSSLLNRLLGRKGLAKVSSTPGKTANINLYLVDGVRFVDLPGYGYAQVSQAERRRWADLMTSYFEAERSHNLVVSLVDVRHDASPLDVQMVGYLRSVGLPFVVALTKADKLSRSRQLAQQRSLSRQLGLGEGQALLTSAATGQGVEALRCRIEDACL